MSVLSEFREAIAAGVGTVAVSLDVLLTGGEMLLSVSDLLFSLTAVLSGTLADEFAFLDPGMLRSALLVAAVLYLTNLLLNLRKRLTGDSDTS